MCARSSRPRTAACTWRPSAGRRRLRGDGGQGCRQGERGPRADDREDHSARSRRNPIRSGQVMLKHPNSNGMQRDIDKCSGISGAFRQGDDGKARRRARVQARQHLFDLDQPEFPLHLRTRRRQPPRRVIKDTDGTVLPGSRSRPALNCAGEVVLSAAGWRDGYPADCFGEFQEQSGTSSPRGWRDKRRHHVFQANAGKELISISARMMTYVATKTQRLIATSSMGRSST